MVDGCEEHRVAAVAKLVPLHRSAYCEREALALRGLDELALLGTTLGKVQRHPPTTMPRGGANQ